MEGQVRWNAYFIRDKRESSVLAREERTGDSTKIEGPGQAFDYRKACLSGETRQEEEEEEETV